MESGQREIMPEKYDVFISYSHDDTETMLRVRNYLKSSGMQIWTDEGIEPGTQNWQIAIEQAIRKTDAVVVLLSPASSNSVWVREELGFAQNLGKKVYPLLIKGDETDAIPFGYSKAQWIDIRKNELVEAGLEKLLAALPKQSSFEENSQKGSETLKGLKSRQFSKRSAILIIVALLVIISVITAVFFPNLFQPDNGDMVFIEAGTFYMGNDDGEPNQGPARNVYLDSFWIDTFEVTNSQYQLFVDETNHTPPDHWENGQHAPDLADHPVIGVSWYDAKQFCEWNGAKRLPTEAEWEKAARGNDKRAWPWGNPWSDGNANTSEAKIDFTVPVGTFPDDKSFYGVMDMAGNAQEWVNDWYQEDYYSWAVSQNPHGPMSGTTRVVRGSSYWFGKELAKTYYRSGIYPPEFPVHSNQKNIGPRGPIGFRCACNDCN